MSGGQLINFTQKSSAHAFLYDIIYAHHLLLLRWELLLVYTHVVETLGIYIYIIVYVYKLSQFFNTGLKIKINPQQYKYFVI